MSDTLEVLNEVRAAYQDTANSGDLEGWLSTLTDDAAMLPPDAPLVAGKEAVRSWISENFFEPFEMNLQFDFDEGEVHGSSAWAKGLFTLDLTPREGGDKVKMQGKFIDIFRQDEDGAWKFSRVIWNADAPVEGV